MSTNRKISINWLILLTIVAFYTSFEVFAASSSIIQKREIQSRNFEGTTIHNIQKDFQNSLLDLDFNIDAYNKETKVGSAHKPGFIINWSFKQNKEDVTGRVVIYRLIHDTHGLAKMVYGKERDIITQNKDAFWDLGFAGWGASECIYTIQSTIACDLYVPASAENYADFWKYMEGAQLWKLTNILPEDVR